jgi:MoaA/NifB/PqqE/SkfB family radical SAM enzyme
MKRFHFVTLYATRRCDLDCAYCDDSFHLPVAGPNAPVDNPFDPFWKDILSRWCPETEYFSILGGEPTLYKDLPQMVRFIADQGCKLGITTDGRASLDEYKELVTYHGLPEIACSIDSLRRDGCVNKSAWIKAERNLVLLQQLSNSYTRALGQRQITLLWCTVVTRQNIGEITTMAKMAADMGVIFAPCPVQEGYSEHRTLSVASSSNRPSAAHPDMLKQVAELLLCDYDNLKLAEPREYYELWTKGYDMDRVWHCSNKLRAPSIDQNGSMWACYAYQGHRSTKLNALTSSWEEIHKAADVDMYACAGCSWNCLWTSDQIAQGIIKPDFWV